MNRLTRVVGPALRCLAFVVVGLALSCCGHDGFDPTTARPCDFFSAAELENHGLVIAEDETLGCTYLPKIPAPTDLTSVTVEYGREPPATIAASLHLGRPEGDVWEHSQVEFVGSVGVKGLTGRCVLVAPIRNGDALVVLIGVDTSMIEWNIEPITDPCKYAEFAFDDKILNKLDE